MFEPQHPHFVLSDGMYCHVLDEGLYIGKKDLPKSLPESDDTPDILSMIFQAIAALVFYFFVFMSMKAGYYVITFMTGVLAVYLSWKFYSSLGFTQTNFIRRADVLNVSYLKKNFGYDAFVITYAGKDGKAKKRRLTIYDSRECLVQALDVMQQEGLLK
ncbi:MAG: hypothetical protein Fur0041_01170 [Bacteroidia bacterium]